MISKIVNGLSKFRKRIFIYSDETSTFRELENVAKKFAGIVCIAFFLGILGTVSIMVLISSSGVNVALLRSENVALHTQVEKLNQQLSTLKSKTEQISAQGNELRLLVDLPSMDKSVQKAGTGGAAEVSDVTIPYSSNPLLSDVLQQASVLKRQLDVQQQSYAQIKEKLEYNKKFYSCLPALKPMEGYYSPTGFGIRMHPVLGIYKTHVGLDIISDIGTPIYASGDGVVEFSGRNNGGYGLMIEINHGFGYQTLYAHCSKLLVKEGQRVKRGDIIAKSGKTGLVTGPHLHYEVSLNGVKQNPVDFFFDNVSPTAYHHNRQVASK